MHIFCKCGFRLTNNDLFLTKKWRNTGESLCHDDSGGDEGDVVKEIPILDISPGSFINGKHWWSRRPIIRVNRDDLNVGVVPVFEEGLGCCDVNINVQCPQCKSEIGEASYDCYVTRKSVILLKYKTTVTHSLNKNKNHTNLNAFDRWARDNAMALQQEIDRSLQKRLCPFDKWSIEETQDVFSDFGIDVEDEISQIMYDEIVQEVERLRVINEGNNSYE